MDRSSALARLATLTAGLAPTAGTTATDLQSAREALASSLLHYAVDPAAATTGLPTAPSRSPSPEDLAAFGSSLDQAARAEPGGPVPLVFPRSLPAIALGDPALTPAAGAGMLRQSIGPFVDELGALHWFDVVSAGPEIAIIRTTGAPFLVLPLTVPPGRVPATLPVGAGSLWIEAQLLAPAAPAGSYAGIKISGGTLTFSAAATALAGGLFIDATTTLTLTVKPDSPAGPLGGGAPGADGGAVIAELPAEVTFVFTQAGASVTAATPAFLSAYGSAVALQWQQAAAVYEYLLAQILIPFKPQSASFTPASVRSTLFQPAGTAPILGGAWTLPVAFIPPGQLLLGTAASAGMLALVLGQGLRVTWQGLAGGPTGLGRTFLLGAGGELDFVAGIFSANRLSTEFNLWRNNTTAPASQRSSVDLTFPRGATVHYTSIASFGGASQTETVSCGASIAAHIDRPLAADGSRLGPTLQGTLVVYETATLKGVMIAGQVPQASSPPAPIALALHNALLVTTPPTFLQVTGSFTATPTELDTGGLLLNFGLETLLPTLPDPYAANFLPSVTVPNAPPAALLATITWSPTAAAQLGFSNASVAPQSFQVAELPATFVPPLPPLADQTGQEDQTRRLTLAGLFEESLSSGNTRSASPTLFLLDVSSNADQLGVGMAINLPSGQALSIAGLDLVAPCLDQRVFTAPAVQWEPLVTIQNPIVRPFPFPSPASFRDDGGPTLLGAADVTLVPVAPAPLLHQVVSAYDGGAAGAAMFTLPFGMVAVATLPKRPTPIPPFFTRPGLAPVQPDFTAKNMIGGRQVSLTAAVNRLQFGPGTPGLPGAAVQLRNLVDQSFPTGNQLSVLGPDVDVPFNGEFVLDVQNRLVPVTRIDLSGYGASSFSAWADPAANPPAVVQVRFNMMVGRVSHEVVQVKSILYPWGAIVTRTVTIDRQDNSEIYRYDSGWVAATPGTFDIGIIPNITVHSGAVLGAYNIREIRDTTQVHKNGPVELTAVYFDADIQIDGVISGASNGLVPSTGQLGFVQTAPIHTTIFPSDLAELISSQGALGGPVDCVIAVAGTAQTMRLSRVEVANALHAGAAVPQEFAAAARGSLVLPAAGSWSVLARTDNVSEPTPIDADLGVPLIRQGPAGSPTGNTPWRLAEPVDLWVPDAPSMDYCLLHATDSTRMLFPRPKIESGATAFTSTQLPLLVDGFALLEATGISLRQDACLAFPNANYELQISGAGTFTLANVPDPFGPTFPSGALATGRALATGAAAAIGFEYADDSGAHSQISVVIAPNASSVAVKGTNVRLDMTPFNGLMRVVGDLQTGSGASFANARLVLGPDLQPLAELLTFLKLPLPLPDIKLSFSNNGWTGTVVYKLAAAGIQLDSNLVPIIRDAISPSRFVLKLGFGGAGALAAGPTTSVQWFALAEFKINWALKPPLGLVGILKLQFSLASAILSQPSGGLSLIPGLQSLKLQLGAALTIRKDLIPLVADARGEIDLVGTLVIKVAPDPPSIAVGFGAIIDVSGTILDGAAGIEFTAEANGLYIASPSSVEFTFEIEVDVTEGWFFSVPFDTEVQLTLTF
jgi:hypothetical protein